MNPFISIKKTKAICWLDDDILLIYKRRTFYSFAIQNKQLTKLAKMPMTHKQSLLSFFSLGRRLLRLHPQSPVLNKKTNELFFTFCGFVYCLDLNSGIVYNELLLKHGASRVLSFCISNDGRVYFGEYPTKKDGSEICIFERKSRQDWSVVYTFAKNSIRHVHLLIEKNNDLFCFTGDENNEVKIICFNNFDFSKEPFEIVNGAQKYRACVSLLTDKKIYYLTDNPYHQNKLFCIDLSTKELSELASVEGSVIYGYPYENKLYFSTCVERNLTKDGNCRNVSIRIDGYNGGILSKKAVLYCYDLANEKLEKIFELKKDLWSKDLFGFGTFVFPCGSSKKYFAATSMGLKKNETTFIFKTN